MTLAAEIDSRSMQVGDTGGRTGHGEGGRGGGGGRASKFLLVHALAFCRYLDLKMLAGGEGREGCGCWRMVMDTVS